MRRKRDGAMNPGEWLMLLALSGLWGGSFFFFKVLLTALPPFTVVLGRVGLAAVIMNLLLVARRDAMPRSPRLRRQFLVMGLLNNVVPFTLIVFGETRIASGLASILNATTPLFTVLLAHGLRVPTSRSASLFRPRLLASGTRIEALIEVGSLTETERLTGPKLVGLMFGLAGVAVLVGPDALSGLGRGDLSGEGACLLAALVYGLASLYGRRFRGLPPLEVATGQVTASTVVLLPVAALVDRPWTLAMPSLPVWAALVGIALFSTALAYLLYFRILATAGATNLMLVTFMLPISALGLGVLFLGETVSVEALVGMVLIGAGLAAIEGRLWTRVRREPKSPNPRP